MNTPAHLIFGLAVFGKPDRPRVTAAAVAGSLLPDVSLYLLVAWQMLVVGTAPEVVFGQMYFSESWQTVFRIDNSFVLWGIGLGLAAAVRSPIAVAFCGAALLHLLFDFALHNDDARAHFWPATTWVFYSPVSYWDPDHYGGIAGAAEIAVSVALAVVLWRRFTGWRMRTVIALLATVEALPGIVFGLMLAGPG